VFATLSVEDNLLLAFRNAPEITDARASVAEAFDLFPRLGERRTQLAGTLSGGEQRMLTLARVLVLRPACSWPTSSPSASRRWSPPRCTRPCAGCATRDVPAHRRAAPRPRPRTGRRGGGDPQG